jgi:hypothetical protein
MGSLAFKKIYLVNFSLRFLTSGIDKRSFYAYFCGSFAHTVSHQKIIPLTNLPCI